MKIKSLCLAAAAGALLPLAGCKTFDDLVAQMMDDGGLSARGDYTLSCVDLLVVQNGPGSLESELAPKLRHAVEDGVEAAHQSEKGRGLKLGHTLSPPDRVKFYDYILRADGVTTAMRRARLREVCDKSGVNMIMWGVYTGDDTEIEFICFLYRQDLDDFSVSNTVRFNEKLPERRKQEIVSDTVRTLLERSLPEPGQPDSRKIAANVKAAGSEGRSLLPALLTFLLSP